MNVASLTIKNLAVWLFLGSLTSLSTARNSSISEPSNTDCINCHEKSISIQNYNTSVHHSLLCNACHIKDETQTLTKTDAAKKTCVVCFKPMNCGSCHSVISKEHQSSVHNASRLPITCSKCHKDIHNITSMKADKVAASKLCIQCHQKESAYFQSIHYKALVKGNKDAPSCIDCHGLHAIKSVDNVAQGRAFHTQACLKCHADANMMARNKVTNIAPETYFESYHGKNMRLGYPERVAGCADCHGSHNILAQNDSNSTVNPAHIAGTCKQCHADAGSLFAKYIPHAEPTNHSKFPMLFWVTLSMNILLVSVFLFFWIHSILWAIRGFVEKKQARNATLFSTSATQAKVNEKTPQKVYRRFRPYQIVMHLFVVTSFLGLALTGLPLKFNQTAWGKIGRASCRERVFRAV